MALKNTTGVRVQKSQKPNAFIDISVGITIPEQSAKNEKPKVISEATIETAFRKMVLAAGGKSFKLSAAYFSGLPDRLILMPGGRAFFAEIKSSIGTASPKQKLTHAEFKTLGFDVKVINSFEQIEEARRLYAKK